MSSTVLFYLSSAATGCTLLYGLAEMRSWLQPSRTALEACASRQQRRELVLRYIVIHIVLGTSLAAFELITNIYAVQYDGISPWLKWLSIASAVDVAFEGLCIGTLPAAVRLAKLLRGTKSEAQAAPDTAAEDKAIVTRWTRDFTGLERVVLGEYEWDGFQREARKDDAPFLPRLVNEFVRVVFWAAVAASANAGLLASMVLWERQRTTEPPAWAAGQQQLALYMLLVELSALYGLTLLEVFVAFVKGTWADFREEPKGMRVLLCSVPFGMAHLAAQAMLVYIAPYIASLSFGSPSRWPPNDVLAIWKIMLDGGVDVLLMLNNWRSQSLHASCNFNGDRNNRGASYMLLKASRWVGTLLFVAGVTAVVLSQYVFFAASINIWLMYVGVAGACIGVVLLSMGISYFCCCQSSCCSIDKLIEA